MKNTGKIRKELNRKRRQKRTAIGIIASIIVVLCIGIGVAVFFSDKDKENDKGYHEITNLDDIKDLDVTVKHSKDYVEPGKGTLDMDKIQGFHKGSEEDSQGEVGGETNPGESNTENTEDADSLNIPLSDPNLKVEAIGSYSGNFIEDGSDEPIVNVAAMLITNNSDKMLQIAEVKFQVNDKETAHFKVTNLPAGTSTLVLESNKRTYSEKDSYTYGETATGYMDAPAMEEDKFEITTEKGKIILKNKTDKSYDKVYVYYKYVQIGGAYLGGITYRTPFENIPANGEVEAIAGHYNPESSLIMGIQVLEE